MVKCQANALMLISMTVRTLKLAILVGTPKPLGGLGYKQYANLTKLCYTNILFTMQAYNIEGAELTDMGQSTVLGAYPIHYHMCYDTDEDGTNPIVKSNSLHHLFSRCVTVHGSHGIHVTVSRLILCTM
jgi:hypothetical protein